MVDTTHGWAVLLTSATSTAVVSTGDGGRTWTYTAKLDSTALRISSLDAVSASTAWACQAGSMRGAGALQAFGDLQFQRLPPDRCFVTADGGRAWTAHEIPDTGGTISKRDRVTMSVVAFAAQDARRALAVVRGERVHTGGGQESDAVTDLRLLRTIDGGATWATLRHRQPQPNESPNLLFGAHLRMKGQHGWLVDFLPGVLERTDDGGDTWTSKSMPSVPGTYLAFVPPDQPSVAVPLISANQPSTIRIASSTDAGTTWQTAARRRSAERSRR